MSIVYKLQNNVKTISLEYINLPIYIGAHKLYIDFFSALIAVQTSQIRVWTQHYSDREQRRCHKLLQTNAVH